MRINASNLIILLLGKSSKIDVLKSACTIFVNQFIKTPTLDQRDSLYTIIPHFSAVNSALLVQTFMANLVKESNDGLYMKCIQALKGHFQVLMGLHEIRFDGMSRVETIEVVYKWCLTGLANSNPLRRSTTLYLLFNLDACYLSMINDSLLDDLLKKIFEMVEKYEATGIQLLDSNRKDPSLFSEGVYGLNIILSYLELLKERNEQNDAGLNERLINLFNKDICLNQKIYSKLCTSLEDESSLAQLVFKALKLGFFDFTRMNVHALIKYLVINSKNSETRKLMLSLIDQLMKSNMNLTTKMILHICEGVLVTSVQGQDKTRSSSTLAYKVMSLLELAIPSNDQTNFQSLMDCCVLASHPILVNKFGNDCWIRLCARANIKPGDILETYLETTLKSWIGAGCRGYKGHLIAGEFKEATLNAMQLFNTISPEICGRVMLPFVINALNDPRLCRFTQSDMDIYALKSGLLTDPLKKKNRVNIVGEEKWELELRLKAEAGKPKLNYHKLTKAEKLLVDRQIDIEMVIRKNVEDVMMNLTSAFDILNIFLQSVGGKDDDDEVVVTNLDPFIYSLVSSLIQNVDVFYKKKEDHESICPIFPEMLCGMFFEIGRILCSRFSSLLDPVQVLPGLVFRLNKCEEGINGLPAYLCQNEIHLELTECLAVLKAAHTPSTPFSPAQFCYIFPILQSVIQNPVAKMKLNKYYIDCLLQSADILFSHASLGQYEHIPSREYVECLITLMSIPKLMSHARDSLVTFCSARTDAMLPSSSISEILQNGLLNPLADVRSSCLDALQYIDVIVNDSFKVLVWRLKFDVEEVKETADILWTYYCHDETFDHQLCPLLVDESILKLKEVAIAGACAFYSVLDSKPHYLANGLKGLYDKYHMNVDLFYHSSNL